MGMFDEIICKYPLPVVDGDLGELDVIDWSKEVFQTKDLDNTLDRFEITETGVLVYSGYLSAKVVGDTWKRIGSESKFHGDIQFGTIIFGEENDYRIEYEARFTDGQVVYIQLLEWTTTSNQARITANKKFKEKQIAAKNQKKKIIYRFLAFCRNLRKRIIRHLSRLRNIVFK